MTRNFKECGKSDKWVSGNDFRPERWNTEAKDRLAKFLGISSIDNLTEAELDALIDKVSRRLVGEENQNG